MSWIAPGGSVSCVRTAEEPHVSVVLAERVSIVTSPVVLERSWSFRRFVGALTLLIIGDRVVDRGSVTLRPMPRARRARPTRTVRQEIARRAYRRLDSEERRRLLVERATELFGEHGYEELSMSRIAREAGISKPLVYHYFPSKKALFAAALQQAAEELRAATEPDPDRPAAEQLAASLRAFLGWIDEHRAAYAKLLRSLAVAEVRELVDGVRESTAQRILDGLPGDGARRPAARAAVHGWLWSIDGACLAWIEDDLPLTPDELSGVLLAGLGGALTGAGVAPPAAVA